MSTNANICQRLRTLSESLGADAEICEYAAERIEELERQVADAKADSERLDWLQEESKKWRDGLVHAEAPSRTAEWKYCIDVGCWRAGATLRAAIDAARKL